MSDALDNLPGDKVLMIGLMVGAYIVTTALEEGITPNGAGMASLHRFTTDEIERLLGVPAEDFVSMLEPQIAELKRVMEKAE